MPRIWLFLCPKANLQKSMGSSICCAERAAVGDRGSWEINSIHHKDPKERMSLGSEGQWQFGKVAGLQV